MTLHISRNYIFKMVKSCEIEFIGNPDKVVYSGQTVNAKVTIAISEPKVIKSMSCYLIPLIIKIVLI